VAQQVIEHTVTAEADPPAVFRLLADGSTWPEWSPIGSFQLLEQGDGSPEGVGAIRLFTTGRVKSRERVVERRPDEVFSYVLERGLAIRDYRAVITLCRSGGPGATTIHWRSTFRSKVPGTGGLYRRQLGKFIKETVDGLATAAARTQHP
jgi:hypothetical protein